MGRWRRSVEFESSPIDGLHSVPLRDTDHYKNSSCSRDILLACSPISILKMALKPANFRFRADFQAPRASQTLENDDFDLFLRYQLACRPIEYRGSSYVIHSNYSLFNAL